MPATYERAPCGEELTQSKLTEEIVRECRAAQDKKRKLIALINAKYSAAALAERFGVGKTTMDKVLTYATWRHVRDKPKSSRSRAATARPTSPQPTVSAVSSSP